MENVFDLAVVGAGIAGMTVANKLSQAGINVVVLEKARGTGGRLSSKRWHVREGHSLAFDLGAPSFQSQTQQFEDAIDHWRSRGWVTHYEQSLASQGSLWVPVPRSSALTRQLARGCELICGVKVSELIRQAEGWQLNGWVQRNAPQPQTNETEQATELVRAKHVILACPAEQTCELLPAGSPLTTTLSSVQAKPQFVYALAFEESVLETHLRSNKLDVSAWLSPLIKQEGVQRVSLESSKPERDELGYKVVTVALSYAASQAMVESKDSDEGNHFSETGFPGWVASLLSLKPDFVLRHRWLYSRYPYEARLPYGYLEDQSGVWVCGDYFMAMEVEGDSSVESAYLSATALADAWLTHYRQQMPVDASSTENREERSA